MKAEKKIRETEVGEKNENKSTLFTFHGKKGWFY